EIQRLHDRVGAAGVPARPEPLLGGHRGDVFTGESAQPPGLRDVAVQGMRLVLGEHTQSQISRVDQIAEYEIDQSIRTAEGDCRLRPVSGERKKAFALATGEHDPEYVRLAPHPAQTTVSAACEWPGVGGASTLDR